MIDEILTHQAINHSETSIDDLFTTKIRFFPPTALHGYVPVLYQIRRYRGRTG